MAELTAKQSRFVDEYLIDLNATQAAIRAGYSEKTAYSIGEENLKKPDIASAVQEAMNSRAERTEVTTDSVLADLAEVRDMCMGRKPLPDAEVKFDASGANRSIELIGKHLKMFTDKVQHSGNMGVSFNMGYNGKDGD